jgi:selenide,water dikinase
VLRPLQDICPSANYPDLIVGLGPADDAAIWRLDESRALAVTTDFFTPVVDEPYDYGAIAAANALSDLYAMGATPILALNIAAVPPVLPSDLVAEIFRGGAEKVREAGAVIAGGHTIRDDEPKYGLVALGICETDHWMTKTAAVPGDVLFLTKPLGIGVTTTALKRQQASEEDVSEAVGWMKRLNRDASRAAVALGVRAATDVTGFSLLGHGHEVASASGVGMEFNFPSLPFLAGARHYAELGCFAGGTLDNRDYFEGHVSFDTTIDEQDRLLLFDAQTSGGLLLAMDPAKAREFRARAAKAEMPAWRVGHVVAGEGIRVLDTPFERGGG